MHTDTIDPVFEFNQKGEKQINNELGLTQNEHRKGRKERKVFGPDENNYFLNYIRKPKIRAYPRNPRHTCSIRFDEYELNNHKFTGNDL